LLELSATTVGLFSTVVRVFRGESATTLALHHLRSRHRTADIRVGMPSSETTRTACQVLPASRLHLEGSQQRGRNLNDCLVLGEAQRSQSFRIGHNGTLDNYRAPVGSVHGWARTTGATGELREVHSDPLPTNGQRESMRKYFA